MRRKRSGVLGIFAHLDTTTDAIRRLREEGVRMTVYSPTPRHEIEEALEVTDSSVRVFTLTGALVGAGAGAALAVWTSLDWPLIVGGKETVALPAFSVIIFEMTILIGALSTLVGLFVNARLPRVIASDAMYHPSFTEANFGIYAHVPAERYDAVSSILSESGSQEVLRDD